MNYYQQIDAVAGGGTFDRARFQVPKVEKSTLRLTDLSDGTPIQTNALVSSVEVREGKSGAKWLQLNLTTSGGLIRAKHWLRGNEDQLLPIYESGVIALEGKIDVYPKPDGAKSITIDRVQPMSRDEAVSLLPGLPGDETFDQYAEELFAILSTLSSDYEAIALALLDQYWDDFVLAPAALYHHHNYVGGLLKHTVCMLRLGYRIQEQDDYLATAFRIIKEAEQLHKVDVWNTMNGVKVEQAFRGTFESLYTACEAMAELKEPLRWDELALGILFHDIGKLFEYSHLLSSPRRFEQLFYVTGTSETTGIAINPMGSLVGHMPYGGLLFEKSQQAAGITLPLDVHHRIWHMILSHHGKREWGSSVLPATTEGWLLHLIDLLDARYEKWARVHENL
ncbi:DNA-binding protein [Exiguobacterium sp. SH5S13]|uniref:TraI domain-containing protein n=1 Tax=unclassified Exiguobacterium TaxID=2644629 RepID=UPI00103AF538|nr:MULTISPECIES: TraI domain-containing protein [unclassified Exiguobacterium]TCI24083.1 DNA-binding protein [Exiguobacterium sp. SH5S4]TCI56670.1 DNA-binding protein [Exiguobacterium sp. SH5S13]